MTTRARAARQSGKHRTRVLVAAALCAALLAVASAAQPGHAAGPAPTPSIDLLPEQLLEPPAPTETQRLIAESRRTKGWCDVLGTLDGLRPPNPDKVTELVVFSQAYHQNTTFLDRRATVTERGPRGGEVERKVPEPLVQKIEIERAAMYAFYARMVSARALRRSRTIDDAGVERRVRYGFVKLMSSGFGEADQELQASRARYCR